MSSKKLIAIALKFGLAGALLAYVAWQLRTNPDSAALAGKFLRPHDWRLLAAACLTALAATTINIFRWRMLVQTLDMHISNWNALRIGLVSYTVSILGSGIGVVGGDALKAVYLATTNPSHKAEAAATVVVDRVVGMLGLLLLAGIGTLFFHPSQLAAVGEKEAATVLDILWTVRALSLGAIAVAVVVLLPGFTNWPLWDAVSHIPKIGHILQRLVDAVRTYRRRADRLALGVLMTFASQSLFTVALHLTVAGLDLPHPSLTLHFVIGPLALITGALPIGAFEITLQLLYRAVIQQDGLPAALAYRLTTVTVALLGGAVYLATRAETQALLKTAESEAAAESLQEG